MGSFLYFLFGHFWKFLISAILIGLFNFMHNAYHSVIKQTRISPYLIKENEMIDGLKKMINDKRSMGVVPIDQYPLVPEIRYCVSEPTPKRAQTPLRAVNPLLPPIYSVQ